MGKERKLKRLGCGACSGAGHEVGALEAVLGERMLQAWRLRAEALQADRR